MSWAHGWSAETWLMQTSKCFVLKRLWVYNHFNAILRSAIVCLTDAKWPGPVSRRVIKTHSSKTRQTDRSSSVAPACPPTRRSNHRLNQQKNSGWSACRTKASQKPLASWVIRLKVQILRGHITEPKALRRLTKRLIWLLMNTHSALGAASSVRLQSSQLNRPLPRYISAVCLTPIFRDCILQPGNVSVLHIHAHKRLCSSPRDRYFSRRGGISGNVFGRLD